MSSWRGFCAVSDLGPAAAQTCPASVPACLTQHFAHPCWANSSAGLSCRAHGKAAAHGLRTEVLSRSTTVNDMFFFFSGRAGCLGSLIISALVTGVFLLLFFR